MRCIDLFAGAGGFTEGARLAGARVVWAANHWPLAVQYHQTNHPDTWHECQDLQQADWRAVPAHDVVLLRRPAKGIRGQEAASGRTMTRCAARLGPWWLARNITAAR